MPDNEHDFDITHDGLLSEIGARNREDRERASSAGESRQRIQTYLENSGLNSQAFSWMRSTIKKLDKADGQHKAMDIIRSLEAVLPMVRAHVEGQGTAEMDMGEDKPEPAPKKAASRRRKAKEPTQPETGGVVQFK